MKQVGALPDDVLLGIFDFYVDVSLRQEGRWMEVWQSPVHVCRRWRSLVFGSPRPYTVRDRLGVWPPLPLIVGGYMVSSGTVRTDNVIVALEQSHRVCEVTLLGLAGWQLEQVLEPMQVPFPELTVLQLHSELGTNGETLPVIPDLFLEGSAPRLRLFELSGIPFPGLPNLHFSATHLVQLTLAKIPHSGYISPEKIAALLSVLLNLRFLSLEFQFPQSRPGREVPSLPPTKRSILPALYDLRFKGVTEYLEELMTLIDAPQLDNMSITFFNQIEFNCP